MHIILAHYVLFYLTTFLGTGLSSHCTNEKNRSKEVEGPAKATLLVCFLSRSECPLSQGHQAQAHNSV